jgi:hypothetical protein
VVSTGIALPFARSQRRKACKAKLAAQLLSFSFPMKNVQKKQALSSFRSRGISPAPKGKIQGGPIKPPWQALRWRRSP